MTDYRGGGGNDDPHSTHAKRLCDQDSEDAFGRIAYDHQASRDQTHVSADVGGAGQSGAGAENVHATTSTDTIGQRQGAEEVRNRDRNQQLDNFRRFKHPYFIQSNGLARGNCITQPTQ